MAFLKSTCTLVITQLITLKNMNGDIVSQFAIDIWAVIVVEVTGIDSCVRDLGTLNEELGDCLWPRNNYWTHTSSTATELNSLNIWCFWLYEKVWLLFCFSLQIWSVSKRNGSKLENTFSSLIIIYSVL